MVNKKKNNKKTPGGKSRRRRANAVGAALDTAALQWRQLLLDPCNAGLVAPCYTGFGTGNYLRTRKIDLSSGVDGIYMFQPSTNNWWSGITGTTGSAIVMSGVGQYMTLPSGVESVRVLAACLRVRYIGAESARAGVIGLVVGTPMVDPSTNLTASSAIVGCPSVARAGEMIHEVKWVPAAADEEFHYADGTGFNHRASCIGVVFTGLPANSLQFELTICYEVEGGQGSQYITAATMPPSKNTANQVLSSLGHATSWAFNHLAAPVVAAFSKGVVQGMASGRNARTIQPPRLTFN